MTTPAERAARNREIGDRLTELREGSGLSQSEFGTKIAVDSDTVSKCERGVRAIDPTTMAAIAKAFGSNVLNWLLTGEEQGQSQSQSQGHHSHVGEEQAPYVAAPSPSIDEDFMAQVGEMVDVLYRQEDSRPSARVLVQVSARLYSEACRVGPDPAERLGALKLLIEQERAALRAAAANPAKSKSSG